MVTQYFKKINDETGICIIFSTYKRGDKDYIDIYTNDDSFGKENDNITIEDVEEIDLNEFLDLGAKYSLFNSSTPPPPQSISS